MFSKKCITYGLIAAALMAGGSASATVLTFDIDGAANFSELPDEYGDNVISTTDGDFSYGSAGGFTPDVTVSYQRADGGPLSFWTTGYSDLQNNIYNEVDGSTGYSVTFTAQPGFLVTLSSFDIGNFGAGVTLPGISVSDGVNELFSQLNTSIPASSESALAIELGMGITASELTLSIDTTGLGGFSDNIGIDNILFSQSVAAPIPVPAAAWLFMSGLIGLAVKGRKARSATA